MRSLILLFTILISSSLCFADRIVFIPTGKKIFTKEVKIDFLNFTAPDETYGWLSYGINPDFEISLTGQNINSHSIITSVDASYHYLPALIDISPAVAVGVIDAFGVTQTGTIGYLAFTFEFGNWGNLNQDVPTEFTLGFWTRSEGFLFAGARLPFSEQVWIFAEHDSASITAGLEYSPSPEIKGRVLFRDGVPGFGFTFQKRF